MYRDWEVGDKVVCVETEGGGYLAHQRLKVGEIYRLSSIIADKPVGNRSGVYVDVKGVDRVIEGVPNFFAERFKKLNKPDELHGSKEDFIRLLNANRSKQPSKALVPVKGVQS